jgi:hypothetical protein
VIGKGLRAVATIIDSQSVKAASTFGKDSRGYERGRALCQGPARGNAGHPCSRIAEERPFMTR